MDKAYANALRRKDEIEAELARINSFIAMYKHFSGPEGEQNEPSTQESSEAGNKETAAPRSIRFPKPSEIADMAERLIRGAGHPLTRAQIVERLEKADVELNSEDKPRYVGTILWREKGRFVNIPGEGYTMNDMATPLQALQGLMLPDEENDDEKGSDLI
ncbi:MAG: hypothetical protein E5W43_07140 [Mesorhizobium sp.]|nr:MAG: hypothetical protein E5W43_07140 [Mesorhizobium sp.]